MSLTSKPSCSARVPAKHEYAYSIIRNIVWHICLFVIRLGGFYSRGGGGGGVGYLEKFCMWMCLPEFKILTFAILNFVPFTTHQYVNFVKKTSNFATVGCFLPSFAQNTPNLFKVGAGCLHLWWKPPDPYTKINNNKKTPNFATVGCFLPSFAQNTPNLFKVGAGSSSVMKTPRSLYQNQQQQKNTKKRQAHICIPCQCEYPPPPPVLFINFWT